MPAHLRTSVPVVLVAGLLLAGCGGSSGSPAGNGTTGPGNATSTSPAWSAFDPPTRFDPTPVSALPEVPLTTQWGLTNPLSVVVAAPITLFRTTAFVATPDRMLAVDLTDGQVVTTVTPERKPVFSDDHIAGDRGLSAPALAEVDGRRLVLVAFAVTVPGEGTTPAESRIEIHAADAEDASLAWSFEVAAPGDSYPPAIVGVADGILVLDHEQGISGIDLGEHSVRWHADQTQPRLLIDATVVGVEHSDTTIDRMRGTGLDVADGSRRWADAEDSYEYLYAQRAGAGHVVLIGRSYVDGSHYLRYVDAATGNPAGSTGEDGPYELSCKYDGVSVSICQTHNFAGAVDIPAGDWLWSLPDEEANRIAPTVTAVWHGALYGETDNGPLVVDAHTGEDLETDPGVAPFLVNEFVGLVQRGNGIYVHQATG